MKYDPGKALDLIPKDLLASIQMVNVSHRCQCDRVHYMDNLAVERICKCGAKIAMSRRWQLHYMRGDPAVRRQVKAILKRILVS